MLLTLVLFSLLTLALCAAIGLLGERLLAPRCDRVSPQLRRRLRQPRSRRAL